MWEHTKRYQWVVVTSFLRSVSVCFGVFPAQAEMVHRKNPRALTQMQYCEEEGIPYMVIIGTDEMARGEVSLRTVAAREQASC